MAKSTKFPYDRKTSFSEVVYFYSADVKALLENSIMVPLEIASAALKPTSDASVASVKWSFCCG